MDHSPENRFDYCSLVACNSLLGNKHNYLGNPD